MSISQEARQLRNMAMVQKGSEFFKPEEVARRAANRTRDRQRREERTPLAPFEQVTEATEAERT